MAIIITIKPIIMFRVNRISSKKVGSGKISIAMINSTSAGIPNGFQFTCGIDCRISDKASCTIKNL